MFLVIRKNVNLQQDSEEKEENKNKIKTGKEEEDETEKAMSYVGTTLCDSIRKTADKAKKLPNKQERREGENSAAAFTLKKHCSGSICHVLEPCSLSVLSCLPFFFFLSFFSSFAHQQVGERSSHSLAARNRADDSNQHAQPATKLKPSKNKQGKSSKAKDRETETETER